MPPEDSPACRPHQICRLHHHYHPFTLSANAIDWPSVTCIPTRSWKLTHPSHDTQSPSIDVTRTSVTIPFQRLPSGYRLLTPEPRTPTTPHVPQPKARPRNAPLPCPARLARIHGRSSADRRSRTPRRRDPCRGRRRRADARELPRHPLLPGQRSTGNHRRDDRLGRCCS